MLDSNLFEITSGKVCITDPCYTKKTWCSAWNIPVENGIWKAEVEEKHGRIEKLICELKDAIINNLAEELISSIIGVDSGQCGIFDQEKYPDEGTGSFEDNETFYGKCCEITLRDSSWGVLKFGVVSSSGWGDGTYYAKGVKTKDGKFIKITIFYMDLDDDIDDDIQDCVDEDYHIYN